MKQEKRKRTLLFYMVIVWAITIPISLIYFNLRIWPEIKPVIQKQWNRLK